MWKIMLSAARKLPERTRKKAAGANAPLSKTRKNEVLIF